MNRPTLADCAKHYNDAMKALDHHKLMYKDISDTFIRDTRCNLMEQVYQCKINYANVYHGPHAVELERLYKEALELYVNTNTLIDPSNVMPEQLERLKDVYHLYKQAEKNWIGCVNK